MALFEEYDKALGQILFTAARARRLAINAELLRVSNGSVMSGPFAGLRVLPQTSWGDGDLAPKVLGVYERELHDVLAEAVRTRPRVVVNVGCAEGYYAVGLARLLPEAKVWAFDSAEAARRVCRETAVANGVAERVTIAGVCDSAALLSAVAEHPALLVIDCEGFEKALLCAISPAALARHWLIVECHNFIDATIESTLQQHFLATHDVALITEGARNPNAFSCLRSLSSLDRWLAVNENRPCLMSWLSMKPRMLGP